jgi:hypothetical protein
LQLLKLLDQCLTAEVQCLTAEVKNKQTVGSLNAVFVSMVAAGAAGTLVQGTAAAAQPAPKTRNVVLVHGLFADGLKPSVVSEARKV